VADQLRELPAQFAVPADAVQQVIFPHVEDLRVGRRARLGAGAAMPASVARAVVDPTARGRGSEAGRRPPTGTRTAACRPGAGPAPRPGPASPPSSGTGPGHLALRPHPKQTDYREVSRVAEIDRAVRLRQPQRHTAPAQASGESLSRSALSMAVIDETMRSSAWSQRFVHRLMTTGGRFAVHVQRRRGQSLLAVAAVLVVGPATVSPGSADAASCWASVRDEP
jgi:hypothetical protein